MCVAKGYGGVKIKSNTVSALCVCVWSIPFLPSGCVPSPSSLQTGACACMRADEIAYSHEPHGRKTEFFSLRLFIIRMAVAGPRGGHEWMIAL